MNPPRLPYHLSNDIVRRGGVLWVEFWEAANGTSVGWNHLRRWLRNPNEKEIIDCKCAQLYGVNSKCIARHTNWGLRTCSCDCCQAALKGRRVGQCLYCLRRRRRQQEQQRHVGHILKSCAPATKFSIGMWRAAA